MTTTRTCSKCDEAKPATLDYFFKHKVNGFGEILLKGSCKICCMKNVKRASRESILRSSAKYYHKNKDDILKKAMIKNIKNKTGVELAC